MRHRRCERAGDLQAESMHEAYLDLPRAMMPLHQCDLSDILDQIDRNLSIQRRQFALQMLCGSLVLDHTDHIGFHFALA